MIARNFATIHSERLSSLTLLCSAFKRNEKEQQIVNDRFALSKKSRFISKQALKRWFTDEYLNSGVYSNRVSSQPLDPNKTEKLEEHLTHVSEDPPSNETRWQQLFEKTLLDEMNKE